MRVLAGCEYSGVIRDAFLALGHDAWSCDLEPTAKPGPHIQDDVRNHLGDGWDLAIFDPQRKWVKAPPYPSLKIPAETLQAVEFVKELWAAPIPRMAIMSVDGYLPTHFKGYDQTINAYDYGENADEMFRLWLKHLPGLEKGHYYPGEVRYASPDGRWIHVWGNQIHKQGQPNVRTISRRGVTYPGIAKAMAEQWGKLPAIETDHK